MGFRRCLKGGREVGKRIMWLRGCFDGGEGGYWGSEGEVRNM